MIADKNKEIELLIDKAAKAESSEDALRFSQAACNAASAVACTVSTEAGRKEAERDSCSIQHGKEGLA